MVKLKKTIAACLAAIQLFSKSRLLPVILQPQYHIYASGFLKRQKKSWNDGSHNSVLSKYSSIWSFTESKFKVNKKTGSLAKECKDEWENRIITSILPIYPPEHTTTWVTCFSSGKTIYILN